MGCTTHSTSFAVNSCTDGPSYHRTAPQLPLSVSLRGVLVFSMNSCGDMALSPLGAECHSVLQTGTMSFMQGKHQTETLQRRVRSSDPSHMQCLNAPGACVMACCRRASSDHTLIGTSELLRVSGL